MRSAGLGVAWRAGSVSVGGDRHVEAVWLGLQADSARLVANAVHLVIEDARHWLQDDRPDSDVAAIRHVLAA